MTRLPCRIVLEGDVNERFAAAFEGLALRREAGHTELSGTLADQSQLQGLLNRIFDLGLRIVSLHTGHGCARSQRSPGAA